MDEPLETFTCARGHAIAWDVQLRWCALWLSFWYSPNVAGTTPGPSMPGMVVVLQWLRAKLIASGTAVRKLDFELKQPPLQPRNPFMNILEGCDFLLSIEADLCTIRAAHSQRSFDMLHKTERKKGAAGAA